MTISIHCETTLLSPDFYTVVVQRGRALVCRLAVVKFKYKYRMEFILTCININAIFFVAPPPSCPKRTHFPHFSYQTPVKFKKMYISWSLHAKLFLMVWRPLNLLDLMSIRNKRVTDKTVHLSRNKQKQ